MYGKMSMKDLLEHFQKRKAKTEKDLQELKETDLQSPIKQIWMQSLENELENYNKTIRPLKKRVDQGT